MVFNVTFNNISVLSWRSFLLVEETGVPGENHRPAASKLDLIMLYRVSFAWVGFELAMLVVICTDCIGRPTFNYHTIVTTTTLATTVYLNEIREGYACRVIDLIHCQTG